MRVCTPDMLCVEIEGPSREVHNFRKGIQDVPEADGKAILAAGGFQPSLSGTAASPGGFVCRCGFRSWFRACSRCGAEAERA